MSEGVLLSFGAIKTRPVGREGVRLQTGSHPEFELNI